jgi:hypothetical protein
MNTHRIEMTIDRDGILVLNDIPFHAGDQVEVIIVERQPEHPDANRYPLRGQPVEYDGPFEPVSENEWNALG